MRITFETNDTGKMCALQAYNLSAALAWYVTQYIGVLEAVTSNFREWEMAEKVTWGMTAPGGKTVPHVDNLNLPRTFTEYTEWCYHLPDTCFERRASGNRLKLRYSIVNIYTCFDSPSLYMS